ARATRLSRSCNFEITSTAPRTTRKQALAADPVPKSQLPRGNSSTFEIESSCSTSYASKRSKTGSRGRNLRQSKDGLPLRAIPASGSAAGGAALAGRSSSAGWSRTLSFNALSFSASTRVISRWTSALDQRHLAKHVALAQLGDRQHAAAGQRYLRLDLARADQECAARGLALAHQPGAPGKRHGAGDRNKPVLKWSHAGRVYTRPQPMSPPIDANRLLAVVAEVAREARPRFEAYVALDSSLERELGLDSLARVELVPGRGRRHAGADRRDHAADLPRIPVLLLRRAARRRHPGAALSAGAPGDDRGPYDAPHRHPEERRRFDHGHDSRSEGACLAAAR